MSITSIVNDLVTSVSVINALKPLPPTISGYSVGGVDDTALDPAGGQTVQINGTGFLAGATITFDGSAVAVVTYVNPNQLTFTSPAKTAGTYTIYAVNPDGGTAIFIPGIIYSVLPTWTTSAGTLGSYYETTSISNTVIATGDAPITYSLFSGSLPAGSTLYANGVITGTAPVDSSSTTYSFTIQATDAQLQDSTRSFSLTINVDAVTWVSPANATTYTSAVDSAISNVALSATDAAGYNVSYSANALPTGLSLSGANISGTPTVIADSSTLLTATAATTNRTATRTINWSITVANDIYFEYNTLLIPGASTTFVDDASTNNFAVTIFGDTKPNNLNPYTPGYYSNYFDGTGDYLTVPSNAALNFGTGDFTIEAWVYPNSLAADWFITSSIGIGGLFFGYRQSSAPQGFGWGRAGVAWDYVTASGTSNVWQHVALTRSGTSMRLFVNGTQVGTTQTLATAYDLSTTNTSIGSQGTSYYLTGYISNLRVVKGTAVYTTTFTPSTTPLTAIANTSLLTCQSNRFIDNSDSPLTITVNGNTTINSFDPFVPNSSYSTYGSGYFDGTGDYLSIPSNSALQLPTGDFTIEAWIYLTGALGSYYFIFTQTGATNATSNWDFIVNGNASGQLRFEAFSGGTQIINLIGTSSVPVNAWTHVAVTRSGSTYTIWMNGISQGTASSASTVNSNAITTYIGENNNNTYYFPGYITDVRIVKGTAVYTTAFTPPSEPLTAIANTSLLVLQNNQSVNNSVFLDNSTNNFLVTRNGNTTQGTFSPYGGNWSNYFDGTGGNFLLTTTTSIQGSDFTIEGWFYTTNIGSSKVITSNYQNSSNGWSIQLNTSNIITVSLSGDGVDITGTTVASINTWYHFALCGLSGSLKLYLNGVQEGSTFSGATTLNSTQGTTVGGLRFSGSNYDPFYGYISNVRIVKGTAVYTANFTPPTTPLTAITNTATLLCQSNRFIDNSINNYPITLYGTVPTQRFSPFNPSSLTPTSYSGYFAGTTGYLGASAGTNVVQFALGSVFTFECWIYPTVNQTQDLFRSGALEIGYQSATAWGVAEATVAWRLTTTTLPTLNVWNHIAIVRTGTSTNQTQLYLNGISVATGTYAPALSSNQDAYIGAYSDGTYPFTGSISNVRVVKGVAVYTGTFTVPTSPLTATQSSGTNIAAITGTATSLLTCQNSTFIDNSSYITAMTTTGSPVPRTVNPFGFTSATTNGYTVSTIGGSGYFDGSGDWLSIPNNAVFNFAANNFTIEGWMYQTSAASGVPIVCKYSTGVQSFYIGVYTGGWDATIYYGSSSYVIITSGTVALALNTWNHFALVRNGANYVFYVNGIQVATSSNVQIMATSTHAVTIGSMDNRAFYFPGYIADVRIVNGTALYTSNFVPPSEPLTAVKNTALLNNMTSAGIYDAAMMNNMESVADAKLSTAVSKFGGSSMSFDGTGDYLTSNSATTDLYAFGSGNFTIEMWLYLNSVSGTQVFYDQRPLAGGVYPTLYMSGSTLYYYTNAANRITGSTLSTSQWYHIAVSRSGTSTKLFVNGTQSGSTYTDTNVYLNAALRPFIGGDGTNLGTGGLNGYIDDLRVTKGYARYTSNFTAPTSAFPIY